MKLSRRDFLKASGGGVGAIALLGSLNPGSALAQAPKSLPLKQKIGETVSVCAYCAGGRGLLIGSDGSNGVNVEGNPEHPINRGALCSKAQSLYQIRTVDGKLNTRRLTKVLYRAPNATQWQEKTWDWALTEIAKRVKKTRDQGFIQKDADGVRMTQGEKQCGPATGGAAADDGGKGAQLSEQLVNVVGPDLIFRIGTIDNDIGRAAIAPVMQQHAIAAGRDRLRQLDQFAVGAAASRRQRDPGPGRADDLVVDVNSAHHGFRHFNSISLAHDLIRKPVPTFRDHALGEPMLRPPHTNRCWPVVKPASSDMK